MSKNVRIIANANNKNLKTANIVISGGLVYPTREQTVADDRTFKTIQDSGGTIQGLPTIIVPGYSAGGGGGTPDWVSANAKIQIDLVNNRAWTVADGTVAIDTLLGRDTNAETGWGTTGYDAADLTADGLVYNLAPPCLINGALSKVIAGATMVVKIKQITTTQQTHYPFVKIVADGSNALEIDLNAANQDPPSVAHIYDWSGPLDNTIPSIVNGGNGAVNVTALTVTNARLDAAVNGSEAVAGSYNSSDFVAVVVDPGSGQFSALQSITIYDPLPDTTGLSALSALS